MVTRNARRLGVRGLSSWIVIGAFMLPFLWMVLGSFKTTGDFLAYPPVFWFAPTLDNYRHVFADNAFARYVVNSVVVALGATAIGLVLGIPAAMRWHAGGGPRWASCCWRPAWHRASPFSSRCSSCSSSFTWWEALRA
jgi:ABC-type spermidine/putrescine transport system permease subunit II